MPTIALADIHLTATNRAGENRRLSGRLVGGAFFKRSPENVGSHIIMLIEEPKLPDSNFQTYVSLYFDEKADELLVPETEFEFGFYDFQAGTGRIVSSRLVSREEQKELLRFDLWPRTVVYIIGDEELR